MKARIAGIIDCHGGLRIVAGTRRSIYANCNIMYPERVFLLPRECWVELDEVGQIPWHMIPWTIDRVKRYIKEWIDTRNDPDNLKHIAIQRYMTKDLSGGSMHIAGFLPPPQVAA